jgi:hypothetical protein
MRACDGEPSGADTVWVIAATQEQLRNVIDQGRTGDKVGFPDPAAAPLGTEEAKSRALRRWREVRLSKLKGYCEITSQRCFEAPAGMVVHSFQAMI